MEYDVKNRGGGLNTKLVNQNDFHVFTTLANIWNDINFKHLGISLLSDADLVQSSRRNTCDLRSIFVWIACPMAAVLYCFIECSFLTLVSGTVRVCAHGVKFHMHHVYSECVWNCSVQLNRDRGCCKIDCNCHTSLCNGAKYWVNLK